MTRAVLGAAAIFLLGLGGCGSSPPSTFYALTPESGASKPAPVRTMKLRRPGLAAYLDRPEIVTKVQDHRLAVRDTDRWAAPLDEMLGRILAQDVEQRLAGSMVIDADGAITSDADVTIEVDIRRFDTGEGGTVQLEAAVAIETGDSHAPSQSRAVHLQRLPREATTSGLVSTMSELLGELADQIAALVQTGGPTQKATGDVAAGRLKADGCPP